MKNHKIFAEMFGGMDFLSTFAKDSILNCSKLENSTNNI